MHLDYELRSDGRRLATFHKNLLDLAGARFEINEARWRIDVRGLFCPSLRLFCEGTPEGAVVVESGLWGTARTIRLDDGRTLLWRITNSLEWELRFDDERPLARFVMCDLLPRVRASVSVAREAVPMPQLLPLLSLGWYLALMQNAAVRT